MIKLIQFFLPGSEKSKQFLLFSIILLPVVFSFCSCSTYKNSYYFKEIKGDTTIADVVNKDIELKIQKNDILTINVSSLNPTEDALFNLSVGVATSGSSEVSAASVGYKVDTLGNIQMHRLGLIHVEGMTLKDLKTQLEKELTPFLKEPIVTVNFANHHVTIIGGVNRVQQISIPEQGLTILDALTLSGDMTQDALKKDILIIRDTLNNKQFKHINLENGSFFKSQWYYLKPNDLVYTKPNFEKAQSDETRQKVQQYLTIASISISLLLIVFKVL